MIRDLLKQGKPEEALATLLEIIARVKEWEPYLLDAQTSYGRLETELRQGTITNEALSIARNKRDLEVLRATVALEKEIQKYFPYLQLPVTDEDLDNQLQLKLQDRYNQLEFLGEGNSSMIYKVREVITNKMVIVRVLKKHDFTHEEDLLTEKLNAELKEIYELKHRNVIKVLGAYLADVPKHIVLEYINGISLRKLLDNIPFTAAESLRLVRQIAEALYYLHIHGIIHGRIRPSKVLVDYEQEPMISPYEVFSSNYSTFTNEQVIEDLMYAPPETVTGRIHQQDAYSDQFTLGLLTYELLAGFPLFSSREISGSDVDLGRLNDNSIVAIFERRRLFFTNEEYRKSIFTQLEAPEELKTILRKLLARFQEDRYNNMAEVINDLDQIVLPKSPHLQIAFQSLDRSLTSSVEFIDDLEVCWEKLQGQKDLIEDCFHWSALFKRKKDRRRILRAALPLFLQDPPDAKDLEALFHTGLKNNLPEKTYKTFFKAIEDTIKAYDYVYKTGSKGTQSTIEKAWKQVSSDNLKVIRVLRKEG